MSHWTDAEITDLKQSYSIEPTTYIARRLGRSIASVRNKAILLRLSKPRNITEEQRCWKPEQVAMLCDLFPTTPTKELTEMFHRSTSCIRAKASELGLHKIGRPGFKRPEYQYMYRVNERTFECLTPETAYVLGFILADGCIYVTKTSSKILRIVSMDTPILEKMREVLQSNHPLDMNHCPTLAIANNQLVNGLIALGITPNKSLTATIPKVFDELFPHLLRGYFDGDGSVRYSKRHGLEMRFVSGSRMLLEQIAERITLLFHIPLCPVRSDKDRSHIVRLSYHSANALRLADIMYANAVDLYLSRKQAVFEHYRNVRTRVL